MRLTILVLTTISAFISFSQNNKNYRLESAHIWFGKENLHHGNQTLNQFSNSAQDQSVFIHNDSGLTEFGKRNWYNYHTFAAEVGISSKDSRKRFIIGAGWNKRLERHYTSQKQNNTIIDTVYAPVVGTTSQNNNTVYYYSYDSLLLDSLSRHEQISSSYTTNIFIHGEVLWDFTKNKYRFSTGVGLSLGASIKNEVTTEYNKSYGLRMLTTDNNNSPAWYADIPVFNPQQGTLQAAETTEIESYSNSTKGNVIVTIKPYIPFRIEAQLADKGFFSRLGVMGSANAGLEFQIVKNDGINSRFFWNYRFGTFYRI